MKEKKATISAKGASVKQWSDLILELNLMKKAWHRYGVDINIQAPGIKKIISWGTKKYRGGAISGSMAYAYAAQVVEVSVDPDTAEIKVEKVNKYSYIQRLRKIKSFNVLT